MKIVGECIRIITQTLSDFKSACYKVDRKHELQQPVLLGIIEKGIVFMLTVIVLVFGVYWF